MTTLVNETIGFLFKAWKSDGGTTWPGKEAVTQTQKKLWPTTRKLTWKQLATDADNTLFLPAEDGYDGLSVGSRTHGIVVHYNWNEEQPVFPPAIDLVRLGLFFHLGFYRTLILVLKSCWEKYFSERLWAIANSQWDVLPGDDETVKDTLWKSIGYFKERSKPFTAKFIASLGDDKTSKLEEIYQHFERFGLASEAGYTDYSKFKTLCIDILDNEHYYHLDELFGRRIGDYINERIHEHEMLSVEDLKDQEEFWIKKSSMVILKQDIGEVLYLIQERQISNLDIEYKWYAVFGKLFSRVYNLQTKVDLLNKRIEFKSNDENLSLDDIEILMEQEIKERMREQKLLEEKTAMSECMIMEHPDATVMGPEETIDYKHECKKVLIEIFFKTHPDSLGTHNFSERQKNKLREYFEAAFKIKKDDPDFSLKQVQLFRLQGILARVLELWRIMGLELDGDDVIFGVTIKEQISWLESRLKELEKEKSRCQSDLNILSSDRDIKEKKATLSSEETKKSKLEELNAREQALRSELDILKEMCKKAALLKEEEATW